MFADSKYSKFLTALLIIVIIVIIGLLSFLGFDLYQQYFIEKDAKDFLENYEAEIGTTIKTLEENTNTTVIENETSTNIDDLFANINTTTNTTTDSTTTTSKKPQYKGFDVSGRIQIPAIDLDYPVLSQAGKKEIEVAVGIQYGPGLNQHGNTIIAGHNYRNGLFFSNNKKLQIGDSIYITDNSGTKVKYVIYNKYETTPEDTDYWLRDTGGAREISLTTCTDDSKARLIIWAKAE